MQNIEAVVTRLQASKEREDKQRLENGIEDGRAWAKDEAEWSELRMMATGGFDYFPDQHPLYEHLNEELLDREPGERHLYVEESYYKGFEQGASEVWEAAAEAMAE